jgi:hypothetical protein
MATEHAREDSKSVFVDLAALMDDQLAPAA